MISREWLKLLLFGINFLNVCISVNGDGAQPAASKRDYWALGNQALQFAPPQVKAIVSVGKM